MNSEIQQLIASHFPDQSFSDIPGFEAAIVGINHSNGTPCLLYSKRDMIGILVSRGVAPKAAEREVVESILPAYFGLSNIMIID